MEFEAVQIGSMWFKAVKIGSMKVEAVKIGSMEVAAAAQPYLVLYPWLIWFKLQYAMVLGPNVGLSMFLTVGFTLDQLYYLILPTLGECVRFQSCLLLPLSLHSIQRAGL